MFLVNAVSLAILVGCTVGGYFLGNSLTDNGLIGLIIGFIVGIILVVLISYLVTNRIKAAQIGMMAIGVTDGELPEHTFREGFNQLKGRFGKLTAFFFIMNAIKGVFRQLGRTINKIGTAVGGQAGDVVTSTIDSAVQTLIAYLCDCCLGWVMYNKDQGMAKSACEGAVIFFKHGKTLIRNIGRIFGMGFLSFFLVGGAFFGIIFVIFYNMPTTFANLAAEIAQNLGADAPEFITNPTLLAVVAALVIAVIAWTMVHSVVGRPFILVGVLRNFMASGLKDRPTEQDFTVLDARSPRFAKLHNSI